MTRLNFPKAVRLLKSSEFDRVFGKRLSFADGLIVAYFALREESECNRGKGERPRLGLVVSRKCGNAVVRNSWKRSLREAFRLVQHDLPRNLDLVVMPRRGTKPDVARLQNSFRQLSARAASKLANA